MNIMNIFAVTAINPDDVGIPKLDAATILINTLNVAYFAASVTAVIVVIVAGYYFVTSSGSPESTRKAKDMMLYGSIGLVVIIIAYVVTQFVRGTFQ